MMIFHLAEHPYIRAGDDQLVLWATAELFLLCFAMFLMTHGYTYDAITDVLLSLVLITLTCAVMVAFIALTLKTSWKLYLYTLKKRMLARNKTAKEQSVVGGPLTRTEGALLRMIMSKDERMDMVRNETKVTDNAPRSAENSNTWGESTAASGGLQSYMSDLMTAAKVENNVSLYDLQSPSRTDSKASKARTWDVSWKDEVHVDMADITSTSAYSSPTRRMSPDGLTPLSQTPLDIVSACI
eukprot:g22447.t1